MLERYDNYITFIPSKWAKASPIHFLNFNRFILFDSSTIFDFHSESEYESDSPSKETNKPFNDKLWNYVLYENNKMNKYEKKSKNIHSIRPLISKSIRPYAAPSSPSNCPIQIWQDVVNEPLMREL